MKPRSIVFLVLAALSGVASVPAYADAGIPPIQLLTWSPARVSPGGVTPIMLSLGNPGTAAPLTGVATTITLPAGLTVPGTFGPFSLGCGSVSLVAPSTIIYTAGTIPANTTVPSSCIFAVSINASTEGIYTATSSPVTSNEGGAGLGASAILTVANVLTISQAFSAASIPVAQSLSLTYTIANPNTTVAATGVGFNNTLPAGVVVASPSGAVNTCGGAVTAVAGAGAVQLTGGSLAAASNCTVTVNLTPTTVGVKNNSVQVTSTNLFNGNTSNSSVTATAAIVVPTSVPTLSEIALILLSGLVAIAAILKGKRVI